MANLSSNGQEVARYVREETSVATETQPSEWSKTEYSFRSNGKVLKKLTVRLTPDSLDPKGRLHSYGWKVAMARCSEVEALALINRLEQRGYVKQ